MGGAAYAGGLQHGEHQEVRQGEARAHQERAREQCSVHLRTRTARSLTPAIGSSAAKKTRRGCQWGAARAQALVFFCGSGNGSTFIVICGRCAGCTQPRGVGSLHHLLGFWRSAAAAGCYPAEVSLQRVRRERPVVPPRTLAVRLSAVPCWPGRSNRRSAATPIPAPRFSVCAVCTWALDGCSTGKSMYWHPALLIRFPAARVRRARADAGARTHLRLGGVVRTQELRGHLGAFRQEGACGHGAHQRALRRVQRGCGVRGALRRECDAAVLGHQRHRRHQGARRVAAQLQRHLSSLFTACAGPPWHRRTGTGRSSPI